MAGKPGAGKTTSDKKRAIFEEVGAEGARPVAAPGGIDAGRRDGRKGLRIWLAILFVMVAAMVLVGGLTRLSDAGLSITQWKPVSGALPPMNAADWQTEFGLYQASPQYELMNQGMELAEFRTIFWWEWGHRQLGRLVGLVWAVGLAIAGVARAVPPGWWPRFIALGALGGVQGAIGWWMVSSGLVAGRDTVASYRLATHLGLAFALLGLILWSYLGLGRRSAALLAARRSGEPGLSRLTGWLTGGVFVQILLGALVAGIDAGRAFPTWPKMGDGWLPPNPFTITPLWRNFFEDAGLVQFVHRCLAYLLLAGAVWVYLRARRSPHPHTRRAVSLAVAMLLVQAVLGIYTALLSAPVWLSSLHQLGAVAAFSLLIRARYFARTPIAATLRG